MDLIAALALVMIIEGLALAVFARSMPELLAEIDRIGQGGLRKIGMFLVVGGIVVYFLVRGGGSAG